MKAIGKITNRMSGDGKFNAVEFNTDEFNGILWLENKEDTNGNIHGLFEFETADQFCRWIGRG